MAAICRAGVPRDRGLRPAIAMHGSCRRHFWRLDVFLSDADVPRVNELTYPSFDVDDPKDMRRLLQGYTEARRAGRFARPGSEVLAELRRAIEVH